LIAAKHGIIEMMRALESKLKSVIHETNSNNENALHLAVKHKQSHVVEGLCKSLPVEIFYSLSLGVDHNENTILHLAAYSSKDNENSWKVSGAAMQMMWDIKWYKVRMFLHTHIHTRSKVKELF
jgi:ankyrin repeat protein